MTVERLLECVRVLRGPTLERWATRCWSSVWRCRVAVMHFLGEAGYRRIAATVMEAKARLVDGLARIGRGLHVWGEPELWAVGFGIEGHDESLADLARWVDEARGVASPSPTRAVC